MTKSELVQALLQIEDALVRGLPVKGDWTQPSIDECWRIFDCPHKRCPAFGRPNVRCWQVTGTFCQLHHGSRQRRHRWDDCRDCPVFMKATPDEDRRMHELLANIAAAITMSEGWMTSNERSLLESWKHRGDRVAWDLQLTGKERELLPLLVQHSRKKVARIARLSQETVKMHLKHIYQKTGVHSREQLIQYLHDRMRDT